MAAGFSIVPNLVPRGPFCHASRSPSLTKRIAASGNEIVFFQNSSHMRRQNAPLLFGGHLGMTDGWTYDVTLASKFKSWAVSLVESNQTSQSQRVYNVNLCLWISMYFEIKLTRLEKATFTKLYCKGKTKNSDEPKHWQRGWTFKFRWVCNSLIFLEMNELPVQTLLLTLI